MITFDINTNNYPRNVNIKWYRDDELLVDKDFIVESAKYFFFQNVIAYNKIVITFRNTHIPYRYLRIFCIEDGLTKEFYNDELNNLKILEEISSTTENLTINTVDIELNNKNEVGVLFQKTLPMNIYRDDKLIGTFFIDRAEKKSETVYKIDCIDYIGLIENEKFMGGMYFTETVGNIVASILGTIPYELEDELAKRTLTGYIEIQSKRDALQKVIFSAGGIIDCSRDEKIIIKRLSDLVISNIGKEQILSIQETIESITTAIELIQHKYIAKEEESEIFNDTIAGTIKITFGMPCHSVRISGGTLIEAGTNYAIVSGNGNVILYGKGYEDVTIITNKTNPLTVSTDISKIKSYNTLLICNEINLLNNIKFIAKILKIKFNMKNNEMVGDMVNVLGQNARIISLDYNLNTPSIFAVAKLEVI